jgi:uncharacterized protein YqjF (DUF2071 family)
MTKPENAAAEMERSRKIFLSAEWRDLVMLNYEVEPALLLPHVPRGTSLDSFNGKTYVSLVAFRFLRTKLLGKISIPFHANFSEVNLRFYVRRNQGDGKDSRRRGVVFIAEVVPRRAIASVARLAYNENYRFAPMKYRVDLDGTGRKIEFQWQFSGQWCRLSARTEGLPAHAAEGTLQQFITEHYWGYSVQRSGACVEYHVSHPPWEVWGCTAAGFEGDASALYGDELAAVLLRNPDSAFVAEGSPVTVFRGERI